MVALFDVDGYAVPFAEDDAVIEAVAALDDADYSDPAEWPSWTDSSRWTTEEYRPAPPSFTPDPADDAWWADQRDREDTLDRLAAEIEAADRFATMARFHRDEAAARGVLS